MTRKIAQISSPPQEALAHIANGIYRIKSITADVYLTCPHDAAGNTVVVKQSDQSSVAQRVRRVFKIVVQTSTAGSYSGLFLMSPTVYSGSQVGKVIRTFT